MLAPYLLVFTCLAASGAQSGLARFFRNPWVDFGDGSDSYDDGGVDTWPDASPDASPTVTAAGLSTTQPPPPPPPRSSTPDSSGAVGESAVWKVALVVAVLLVAVAGSLSLAYYLCFWRGGRFYYQPQKEGDA